jgi:hypothetical protein
MAYRLPLARFDADDKLPPDFERVFGKRSIVPRGTPMVEISAASFKWGRWQESGEIAEI